MKNQLQLSWMRFAFCIFVVGGPSALILCVTVSDRDSWWAAGAVFLMLVSFFIFMGFGWARLRRENAISPIDRTDIAKILHHLIGPVVSAAVWLGLTLLSPFAVILVWAITRTA